MVVLQPNEHQRLPGSTNVLSKPAHSSYVGSLNMRTREIRFMPKNVLAVSLVFSLLLFAGCGEKSAQQKPAMPSVTVAPVERKEVVEADEFTGRIEPVEWVEVRPRVSGY